MINELHNKQANSKSQDDVAAAEPSIDIKTAQLVERGRWEVPGYKVRLPPFPFSRPPLARGCPSTTLFCTNQSPLTIGKIRRSLRGIDNTHHHRTNACRSLSFVCSSIVDSRFRREEGTQVRYSDQNRKPCSSIISSRHLANPVSHRVVVYQTGAAPNASYDFVRCYTLAQARQVRASASRHHTKRKLRCRAVWSYVWGIDRR